MIHSDRSKMLFLPDTPDEPASSELRPDRFRIAAIGDSFTTRAGVQPYDCFSSRLESIMNLNHAEPLVEIVLFAVEGTSTYQQLPLLKRALATRPNLVLLTICLNDTEDWTPSDELK